MSKVVAARNLPEEDLLYFQAVTRKGIKQDEVLDGYTKWGNKYEGVSSMKRFNGPKYAAEYVYKYFGKDKLNISMLDVAAGTGYVGEQLKEFGFSNIDALEPVESMIEEAKKKNIYKHFIRQLISDKGSTDIPDDTYDCLVMCGGMAEGHIPCSGLYELIRIVKPGGLVCIVMNEEYLDKVDEYKGRLEPLMSKLETEGQWQKVSRDVVPEYFPGNKGVVFTYKIL